MAEIKSTLTLNTSDAISALDKLEKASKATASKVESSFDGVFDGTNAEQLSNEIKKLPALSSTAASKISSSFGGVFGKLKQQVNDTFDSITEGAKTGGIGGLADSLTSQLGGALQKLGPVGAAAGASLAIVGSQLSKAWTAGTEFNNALGDIRAKTGLVGEDFEKLKDQIDVAFKGGVGASVAEATKVLGNAQNILGDTFNPEQIGQFTVKAQAFANVFDKDVNEVLKNSASSLKTFGEDGDTFFGQLSDTARKTNQPADDLLDTINEYSPLMKQAGLSSEEFFGYIQKASAAGLLNTDKLADAIKETDIRLKAGDYKKPFDDLIEGSSGAERAVAEQAKKIAEAANQGSISAADALQQSAKLISDSLASGQISEALASQLQAGLSGTAAEDIGVDMYSKIFSAPIDEDAIRKAGEKAGKELEDATGQYDIFSQFSRGYELFITNLGQNLVAFANDIVAPAFDLWWTYFQEAFVIPLQNYYTLIYDQVFKPLGELISTLFGDSGKEANTLKTIFEAIGKVIGTLLNVALIPLKITFTAVGNVIRGVIAVVNSIKKVFADASKETGVFSGVINAVAIAFQEAVKWIGSAINFVSDFFNTLGQKPKANLKEGAKSIGDIAEESAKATKSVKELNAELGKDSEKDKADIDKDNEERLAAAKDNAEKSATAQREANEKFYQFISQQEDLLNKTKLANQEALNKGILKDLEEQLKLASQDISLDSYDKILDIQEKITLEKLKQLGIEARVSETGRDITVDKDSIEELIQARTDAELAGQKEALAEQLNNTRLNEEQRLALRQSYEELWKVTYNNNQREVNDLTKDIIVENERFRLDTTKATNALILKEKLAQYDTEEKRAKDLADYRAKLEEDNRKLLEKSSEIYATMFGDIFEGLSSDGFAGGLESFFEAQQAQQKLYADELVRLEQEKEKALQEIKLATTEFNRQQERLDFEQKELLARGEIELAEEVAKKKLEISNEYLDKVSGSNKIVEESDKATAEANEDANLRSFETILAGSTALTAALIDNNEAATEASLDAIFKEIQAYIVKGIIQSTASLPWPLGLVTGALATAGLNALFSKLKSTIIGRLDGGLIPGSSGLSGMTSSGQKFLTINENSKPEYVVNAKSTEKYRSLLEAINNDTLDPKKFAKTLNIDNMVMKTSGIEARLEVIANKLDRVENAQLSSYSRNAVEVEMQPLQARGSDFYATMKMIKNRKLRG